MELTNENLEKKLKNLEAQKAQLIANVNACEGGIQTIRGLLSDLDREEPEKVVTDDEGEELASPSEDE